MVSVSLTRLVLSVCATLATAFLQDVAVAAPTIPTDKVPDPPTDKMKDAVMKNNVAHELAAKFQAQLAACPAMTPRAAPPTNVNDVRIDDISVIISMGDSVISGVNSRFDYSAMFSNATYRSSVPQTEFRGTSFATGIDEDIFSLAHGINIMRGSHGKAGLMGTSSGSMPLEFCAGPICPSGSFLQPHNVDVMGLSASQAGSWVTFGNIDNQFKYLDNFYDKVVPPITNSSASAPWKLLIYEHGFNNLCFGCFSIARSLYFSADNYEKSVRHLIDGLHERYTNMIVVVTSPFKLSMVRRMVMEDPVCSSIHNGTSYLCPCVFNNPSVDNPVIDDLASQYNARLDAIVKDYQNRGWTDFAVVHDTGLASADLSNATASDLLSGRDCFHPSVQSHTHFAVGLWNNLFKDKKSKMPYSVNAKEVLYCPTADDRISTL